MFDVIGVNAATVPGVQPSPARPLVDCFAIFVGSQRSKKMREKKKQCPRIKAGQARPGQKECTPTPVGSCRLSCLFRSLQVVGRGRATTYGSMYESSLYARSVYAENNADRPPSLGKDEKERQGPR